MTRIRVAMLVVVFTLISFPLPASESWTLYTNVDEMEGKEETFAFYSRQVGGMSFEVKVRCLIQAPTTGVIRLPGGGVLRLDVTTLDGLLATQIVSGGRYVSNARIDLGDGNIAGIPLNISASWVNNYLYDISIDRTDGERFKIELVAENGTKHVVSGDSVLGGYVSWCKREFKEQRDIWARNQQEAQEAKTNAETEWRKRSEAAEKARIESERAEMFRVKFVSDPKEIDQAYWRCHKLFATYVGYFTVQMALDDEGRVSSAEIVESSGDNKVDQFGLCTIKLLRFAYTSSAEQVVEGPVVQRFRVSDPVSSKGVDRFFIYDDPKWLPEHLR